MMASERQNSDLELRALLHAQPVKIAQNRRHVIEFELIVHEFCSNVHYGLQFIKCRGRESIKCGITIVQSGLNERHHKGLERLRLMLRIRRSAPNQAVVTLAM